MNWAFGNAAEGQDHWQKNFVARPREFGVRYTQRWGN